MPDKLDLTVIVAARNEAANIAACLDSLQPAARVIVVDSHSTDGTADIVAARGAEVVQFDWNGRYPRKRQWALENLDISTAWVALVDADESIPPPLWEEIRSVLAVSSDCAAWLATKQFHFMGRRLRFGGFSHSAVLLFRKGTARFENLLPDVGEDLDMEVHERLIVAGPVGRLAHPLEHRDAKGLAAYISRHNAYSTWEAAVRFRALHADRYGEEAIRPRLFGNVQERRRFLKRIAMRMPLEPWLWFGYHYLLRGGFLEGRRGLIAARIRRAYIEQVRAKLAEKTLAARRGTP
jgi:glycosyltransferase involved in cell wall biosynthesis